ncbi:transcriptional regulator [Myroides pelagicus]|uniref:Transcriptional regulator n=1 Tax=Myroides pelagicus TaxID=270914 RepID=A0A7K1GNG5_9FLAO|nr:transcriptional regulator [Myroides pelagicus]MTH30391.1 transcriptional regulator [Myroides pelagicus]
MEHRISEYINMKLTQKRMSLKELEFKSSISQSQISKLSRGLVSKLSAGTFYSLIKAFDDNVKDASGIVYKEFNFKLNKVDYKKRNDFGELMKSFETKENTIDIIAQKAGLKESRAFDLYYRNGALEAFELIMIEKAIGVEAGTLFELYFKEN